MLRLSVSRQASGISREKSKWGCVVLAVLGEVEVHAADKIPRGVAALQKLLDAALRFGYLQPKSDIQFLPERLENPCSQVLPPSHRRRRESQPSQFRIGRRWMMRCCGRG